MAKSKNAQTDTEAVLKLPDLEQSKSAVLNSLTSPSSQRTYDHAIREFIEWYCSEPRLAFNKTWSPGTEYPWNSGTTLQRPSTCVWLQSGDWPTRLLIAVCSAQTWRPVFAG